MIFDNIEFVWIDLDDTLIDFTTNAQTVLTKLYEEFNLNQWWDTAEQWVNSYEKINADLWNRYSLGKITQRQLRIDRFLLPFKEAGIPEDLAHSYASKFDTIYLDYLAEEKIMVPGAYALLEQLTSKGLRIGILSNGFKEVQYKKIKNTGLETYIDKIVLSDDIGINKPDIRIYRYAQTVSGTPLASSNLMIGDNPTTDIQGALQAGWKTIWLDLPKKNKENEPTPKGSMRVHSLYDIISLLD